MTGGKDPRGAMPLQPAHRPKPRLQAAVIGLHRVVRILLHHVQRRGHQLIQDPRVHGRPVGGDLHRDHARPQRPEDEPPRGGQVTARRQQDIDDLAILPRSATTSPPVSPKPNAKAGSAKSKDSRSVSPTPATSSPRSTGAPSSRHRSTSACPPSPARRRPHVRHTAARTANSMIIPSSEKPGSPTHSSATTPSSATASSAYAPKPAPPQPCPKRRIHPRRARRRGPLAARRAHPCSLV